LLEPELSICCFRYHTDRVSDLDRLNQRLHRRLVRGNGHMPSTTRVAGKLAIRPCFVGARTTLREADGLVDAVLELGRELSEERAVD
jgi:aromatic-L-amino-acid decarboxylase